LKKSTPKNNKFATGMKIKDTPGESELNDSPDPFIRVLQHQLPLNASGKSSTENCYASVSTRFKRQYNI